MASLQILSSGMGGESCPNLFRAVVEVRAR